MRQRQQQIATLPAIWLLIDLEGHLLFAVVNRSLEYIFARNFLLGKCVSVTVCQRLREEYGSDSFSSHPMIKEEEENW